MIVFIALSSPTSSSNIQELIEMALQDYEGGTGINLHEYGLAMELKGCDSAHSVIVVLQVHLQKSQNFRNNVMIRVKSVVHLLHTLSTSGALGEGVSVVCWKAFNADIA